MSSHPRRRSTDTISKGNSLQFVSCPVFTLDKPKQTWYGTLFVVSGSVFLVSVLLKKGVAETTFPRESIPLWE